jgi:glycosyltransferase involved in cell wall biosynthesis
VVTIHDLIYRHFPDLFPGENLDLLDQQLRRVCTLSDHIIAVSQNTKSDLIEFFSIAPSKISVIYQACDKRYQIQVPSDQKKEIKNKYQLPDGFLLYVGSMSERKNLLTVVKAIKRIPTRERTPLVVIGQRTSYTRNVLTYAGQHGLSDAIIFPKNVTTQDLPAIYQSSKIFLYPSLYEGFGIPVLEAITSGTPVVTSATSAMPEAGGPSARLVEPTDVDSIAEAIQEILKDSELTKNMIKGGRHYAKRFRGDVISKQMMGLYSSEVKKFENR